MESEGERTVPVKAKFAILGGILPIVLVLDRVTKVPGYIRRFQQQEAIR